MSKFMLIFGIILSIIAVPILLSGLLDPENSPLSSVIESLACNSPEKLVTETDSWSMPNGEFGSSTDYYCEIEPGQQRDVTGTAFVVLAVSFAVPLIGGILLTIAGGSGLARQQVRKYTEMGDYLGSLPSTEFGSSTVIDLRSNRNNIPPETQEMLNNVLGGFATAFTQKSGSGSLTDRLQQLEEAYENDLISKEEYDRVRQAILDSMDD